MKFYLTEVTRYIEPVNGKTEAYGVYAYDDEIQAKASFHQKMASQMKSSNCAMELISIKSEYGVDIIRTEDEGRYVNPATLEPETPESPEDQEIGG